MNILQISNKGTYPRDGGNLAILNLAEGYLNQGHKVTLLSMITHKHYNRPEEIENYRKNNLEIIGIRINTRISLVKLLLNLLLSNKPYNLVRFISEKFSKQIIFLLTTNTFDFIQLEGLYTLPYLELIRKYHHGKIVYRSHNIEHNIWQENAQSSKSISKKLYYNILARRLKRFEIQNINTYDILLPISNIDANYYHQLNNNKPCFVAPFGIKPDNYNPKITNKPNQESGSTILFIGSLDWIPNQDGLLWFIRNCLPIIINEIEDARLLVAGRNAPKWLVKKLTNNKIQFLGNVENALEFIRQDGIFIVPLFAGSGMRVKIIEAMAMKKAIVSTSKGIEGIQYNENEILIANTPEKFAASVLQLLKDKELQNNFGKLAQNRIKTDYDIDTIAISVLNFIIHN